MSSYARVCARNTILICSLSAHFCALMHKNVASLYVSNMYVGGVYKMMGLSEWNIFYYSSHDSLQIHALGETLEFSTSGHFKDLTSPTEVNITHSQNDLSTNSTVTETLYSLQQEYLQLDFWVWKKTLPHLLVKACTLVEDEETLKL